MTGLAFFVFHAGVMPVLLGLALSRLLSCRREDVAAVIFYTLGLWIGLTTLLTDFALRWAPGLPRSAYLAAYAILAISVVVAALRRPLPQDDWTLFSPSGPVDHVWRGRAARRLQPSFACCFDCDLRRGDCHFVRAAARAQRSDHTHGDRPASRTRPVSGALSFAEADPLTGYLIESRTSAWICGFEDVDHDPARRPRHALAQAPFGDFFSRTSPLAPARSRRGSFRIAPAFMPLASSFLIRCSIIRPHRAY